MLFLLRDSQPKAAPPLSQTLEICATEGTSIPGSPFPTVTYTKILTYSNIVVETATPTITRAFDATTVTISVDNPDVVTVPVTISDVTTQIESLVTTGALRLPLR